MTTGSGFPRPLQGSISESPFFASTSLGDVIHDGGTNQKRKVLKLVFLQCTIKNMDFLYYFLANFCLLTKQNKTFNILNS